MFTIYKVYVLEGNIDLLGKNNQVTINIYENKHDQVNNDGKLRIVCSRQN